MCRGSAFLRLLKRDLAHQLEAPTLWDVDSVPRWRRRSSGWRGRGAYHRIRFARADGEGYVHVETTRPELIPACVALVAHPDDERYKPLFGREVITPLLGVRVPVKPASPSQIRKRARRGDNIYFRRYHQRGLVARARRAITGCSNL